MSEENKAIVRQYFEEVFNKRNLAAANRFIDLDQDFEDHSIRPGVLPLLECNRFLATMYFNAFPDLRLTILDQISEGDTVATRWVAKGTHTGELTGGIPPDPNRLGQNTIKATGRPVELTGIAIDRLLGLLAQTVGNLDQAIAHFEDALAFCRKAGLRPELAWTSCDYADALLQRNEPGDRETAMSLLDESLAISSDLGMRPLMERILSRRDILKA